MAETKTEKAEATAAEKRDAESAKRRDAELKKQQDVIDAVDKANKEDLPKLGGSPL